MQMLLGAVPSSWLAVTENWDAHKLLELLRRVNEGGIAHDDLVAVAKVWSTINRPSAVRTTP